VKKNLLFLNISILKKIRKIKYSGWDDPRLPTVQALKKNINRKRSGNSQKESGYLRTTKK
jgi:hypothetical protein